MMVWEWTRSGTPPIKIHWWTDAIWIICNVLGGTVNIKLMKYLWISEQKEVVLSLYDQYDLTASNVKRYTIIGSHRLCNGRYCEQDSIAWLRDIYIYIYTQSKWLTSRVWYTERQSKGRKTNPTRRRQQQGPVWFRSGVWYTGRRLKIRQTIQ